MYICLSFFIPHSGRPHDLSHRQHKETQTVQVDEPQLPLSEEECFDPELGEGGEEGNRVLLAVVEDERVVRDSGRPRERSHDKLQHLCMLVGEVDRCTVIEVHLKEEEVRRYRYVYSTVYRI